MTDLKTQKNDNDVTEFLNGIGNEEQKKDCFQLVELFEQVTQEKARMWGSKIVGFGSYHYKYASGREGDWFLLGFSPRKQKLSLYLSSGFDGYEDLLKDLGKYQTGKACLYVKRLSEIDIDKLKTLAERSVADMKARHE